jgi:hypothetical protein
MKGRDCWGTARERARIKARFTIRERVANGDGGGSSSSARNNVDQWVHHPEAEVVRSILWRIVEGDRSFFSLPYMEENAQLLTMPLATSLLWEKDNDFVLIGDQKMLSWFGKEGVEGLEEYVGDLETFTVMEYAIWLRRYHVLGSLLLGGVNPCLRGVLQEDAAMDDWNVELQNTGTRVLQRFFDSVPLTLSRYIAKRVVDMRRAAWKARSDRSCLCCRRQIPHSFQLCFGSPCDHYFCEPCLWDDVIVNFGDRRGDVVLCPVCKASPIVSSSLGCTDESSEAILTPSMRRQRSLDKYLALPLNADELKKSTRKKSQTKEKDIVCSSWSQAVLPSLGVTRDVRRDKFLVHVEKGAYPFVKGCLDAGIDIHQQNEYGQTALFVAAWRGHVPLVRLLLDYGSDPHQNANGGLTVLGAANANSHSEIIDLLYPFADTTVAESLGPLFCTERPLSHLITITTLIDPAVDHPGAGSYLIDNAVSSETLDALLELWKDLPIEQNTKKKKVASSVCSVRSYYCDTERCISSILLKCLVDTLQWQPGEVSVLPHMRFLHYSEEGAILPPHVDLCRVDASSGERSTHSFLFYLTDCERGGATTLLQALTGEGRDNVLARVAPKRGRLLLFPHNCPHEGEEVVDAPKILIRGEAILPNP